MDTKCHKYKKRKKKSLTPFQWHFEITEPNAKQKKTKQQHQYKFYDNWAFHTFQIRKALRNVNDFS